MSLGRLPRCGPGLAREKRLQLRLATRQVSTKRRMIAHHGKRVIQRRSRTKLNRASIHLIRKALPRGQQTFGRIRIARQHAPVDAVRDAHEESAGKPAFNFEERENTSHLASAPRHVVDRAMAKRIFNRTPPCQTVKNRRVAMGADVSRVRGFVARCQLVDGNRRLAAGSAPRPAIDQAARSAGSYA